MWPAVRMTPPVIRAIPDYRVRVCRPRMGRAAGTGRGRAAGLGSGRRTGNGGARMSVLAVGLSHRSAELSTLERVAVPAPEVGKVLDELQQAEHIREVMLVSTCTRIEVYAVGEPFHGGLNDVSDV